MSLFASQGGNLPGGPAALDAALAKAGHSKPAGLVTRGAGLNFEVELIDVLATLGYIPSALIGAMVYRIFDLLDHHRRLTLKYVALEFPAGRRAQRGIAGTIHRYSNIKASELSQVYGEGFAASRRALFEDQVLSNLQYGADISARARMAIPFLPMFQGKERDAKAARFKKLLGMGLLNMNRQGLFFEDQDAMKVKPGEYTTDPVGKFTQRRRQTKLLRYFELFDQAVEKAMPVFERDIDRAMTEAGRAALEEAQAKRISIRRAHGRAAKAGGQAFTRYLAMNPGKYAAARRVANATKRAVRQELLGRTR